MTPAQQQALAAWYAAAQAAEQAKLVIEAEQKARKACFAALGLPTEEGQQAEELAGGWTLKYKTPFVRKIDARVVESLRAPLKTLHVSLDRLIEWKPSLVTKEYRELTAEAKAIFDACLTTTAGMPTLELVAPKVQP